MSTNAQLPAQPGETLPGLQDEGGLLAQIPISRRTLYNLRQRGMPHIILPGGRRVLYDLASVLAWLRRHERGGAQ